jgi:signal transduction histidine kinase
MNHISLEDRILQLENRVSILTQLSEISSFLNAQVELTPLLKYIMDVATQIADCEAASVLLWDEKKQQLVFASSTTASQTTDLIGTAVPMDSIAGTIYRENRIVQVDDAHSDPRHYDKVDEDIKFETRSLLGVPMTYKKQVIGVLEAINKRTMPWTADDHNYLSIIAAQAAVAIQGAQLVQELKQANDELNEVDKLKNDFIAIASHELRTPLGVIMGYASFLQEEESPSAQEHAGKVLESAIKLRKIIEDMVNLRYLKQKQSDLHLEDMKAIDVLRAVKAEMMTLMDLRQYNVKLVPPAEDRMMRIDITRLMMAISNMIHNSISFTPAGGSISISAGLGSRHEMLIKITDSGKGIADDQLDKIFEEFYQVEDHMIRKHGGLGIGLSIARAIVNAHGGRIWADSQGLGKGATFTIALPTKDSPHAIKA